MSPDLADLKRLKITPETRAWLSAESQRTGDSPQEIVRDVLHVMALRKIEEARLLVRLAPDSGHSGDARGRDR